MTTERNNVLRVNTVSERTAYLDAVSEIIGNIIAEHKATLIQIAERIDVSLGTISNAFNKKNHLCPTYLSRLGTAYGPHVLSPFARMSGGRVIPIEADEETDALPSTTAAIHKLAIARSPTSPGGDRLTHCELLGMEGEIEAAIQALTALKCRAEKARAA